MVKQIRWANEANDTFENMTAYLQEEFSLNTAMKFADSIYAQIDRLILYPEIGQPSHKDATIRTVKVNKNVIMFYHYDGFEILIVDFFNTRQDPRKRKY
jgi:plasmid stabilization system protein ParE